MVQFVPFRGALLDALAVMAPTECSGCGAADRAVCAGCRLALVPWVHPARRNAQHLPAEPPITVWSALEYSGVAQRVVGAYKDGGRTDAASALTGPLLAAVAVALERSEHAGDGSSRAGIRLATIPSSRRAMRSRGFKPVELLMRRAGLRASTVLRQTGEAADQVGLDRVSRDLNKRGSLAATQVLDGYRLLLVDDIVTTGATLFEARRAITEGGGIVVGYATLAETPRRFPEVISSQETRPQNL
ncbi:MAG TPA: phosphoribosyltransferase family protein [Glaciibacter sp.]|nr:phosphoribosyltransferase family protein [Glaciibacter sp.]